MLHLIRKDFVLMKNVFMLMLPLLVIALYMNKSAILVGVLFCISIIMQGFSHDEKDASHLLFNSLPYTRKEIVSSKYIGACLVMCIILATIFFGHLMIYGEILPWEQLLFIAGIVFLFISFAFPFSYLFNSQYLLISFGVLFVFYLVAVNLFLPNLNDIMRSITQFVISLENYQLYFSVICVIAALYIGSWFLSIRIYCRKEF